MAPFPPTSLSAIGDLRPRLFAGGGDIGIYCWLRSTRIVRSAASANVGLTRPRALSPWRTVRLLSSAFRRASARVTSGSGSSPIEVSRALDPDALTSCLRDPAVDRAVNPETQYAPAAPVPVRAGPADRPYERGGEGFSVASSCVLSQWRTFGQDVRDQTPTGTAVARKSLRPETGSRPPEAPPALRRRASGALRNRAIWYANRPPYCARPVPGAPDVHQIGTGRASDNFLQPRWRRTTTTSGVRIFRDH